MSLDKRRVQVVKVGSVFTACTFSDPGFYVQLIISDCILKMRWQTLVKLNRPLRKTQLLVWKVHSLLNIINVIAIYFQFQKHNLNHVTSFA